LAEVFAEVAAGVAVVDFVAAAGFVVGAAVDFVAEDGVGVAVFAGVAAVCASAVPASSPIIKKFLFIISQPPYFFAGVAAGGFAPGSRL
jgi:hypothetical protein